MLLVCEEDALHSYPFSGKMTTSFVKYLWTQILLQNHLASSYQLPERYSLFTTHCSLFRFTTDDSRFIASSYQLPASRSYTHNSQLTKLTAHRSPFHSPISSIAGISSILSSLSASSFLCSISSSSALTNFESNSSFPFLIFFSLRSSS